MKTDDLKVIVKLDDDSTRALRAAANDVKKLAATAPGSFMAAVRAGMRLQRALDRLKSARALGAR